MNLSKFFYKIFVYTFVFILFLNTTQSSFAQLPVELLTRPWNFVSRGGPIERYQLIDPNVLKGNNALRLIYDLRGTCLLEGDASAIIFDQPINKTWRYIQLSRFGKNCFNGEQFIDVPLSSFSGLDTLRQVGTFHARIWHRTPYSIEIKSAVLFSTNPVIAPLQFTLAYTPVPIQTLFPTHPPTPTTPLFPTTIPTATPFPSPTPFIPTAAPTLTLTATPTSSLLLPLVEVNPSWSIQSVSSMKETKDRVCYQRSYDFITQWVGTASELGANYISLETPYESPTCGDSLAYTRDWIQAIRLKKLNVWHRHMPLAFEGIYNARKDPTRDYLQVISNYIKSNPFFFQEGDIFTPIPEPQNGGIQGVNYCSQNTCIFKNAAEFNAWLRTAMDISEQAFASIGLANKVKIGYYGFDGYIAWGDNNPDWDGILEDATVEKMGNITIDHYPEIVGDTMENDLQELETRYPNIPIIIGEWGTISGSDSEAQVVKSMTAARRPSVVGFNYWHMGIGGNEELIREDFSKRAQFDEVQSFYKKLKLNL